MNIVSRFAIALLIANVAAIGSTIAAAQTPKLKTRTNPNPELVGQLTRSLNITPKQAIGGTGAIFGLAKSNLNAGDFTKLADAVPGMNGFLKAAPVGAGSDSPLGAVGGIVPGRVGGLAQLSGSFQALGLSPDAANRFLPVLEDYIGSRSGGTVASLLTSVLK